MRFPLVCLVGVLSLTSIAPAKGTTYDVFFAGGQSNAKPQWAQGIQATLDADPTYANPLVVHNFHSGNWLYQWYNAAPQANYEEDFFNASGTGVLQAQLQTIVDNGDTYVFRGFFWFQGEGDTGSDGAMDAYATRYNAILAQLQQDMGLPHAISFTLAVIDANLDPSFDDDLLGIGRTRDDIDRMRSILFGLGAMPNGSAVDTRNYDRSDLFHLYPDQPHSTNDLLGLGDQMAQTFINTFAVPEPGSLALLLAVGAGVALRRTTQK